MADWSSTAATWLIARKEALGVVQNLLASLAIVAAVFWFFAQTKFKQRVRFDLDCTFFKLNSSPDVVIAEVQLIFENRGFVEHRLFDLQLAIHGLASEDVFQTKETGELIFDRRLLPLTLILPQKLRFLFVRPGVRQVITHTCVLRAPGTLVRVTASFSYRLSVSTLHYARRVFKVMEHGNGQAPTSSRPIG